MSGRVRCQGGWDSREGGGWACNGCMTLAECFTDRGIHCDGCDRACYSHYHQTLPRHTHTEGEGRNIPLVCSNCTCRIPLSLSLLPLLSPLPALQQTELRFTSHSLNLTWLADRSACFLEQGGNRDSLRDAWTQCLAGLLEPHLLPDACPTSVRIAWPYAFHRMVKAYAVLDPG